MENIIQTFYFLGSYVTWIQLIFSLLLIGIGVHICGRLFFWKKLGASFQKDSSSYTYYSIMKGIEKGNTSYGYYKQDQESDWYQHLNQYWSICYEPNMMSFECCRFDEPNWFVSSVSLNNSDSGDLNLKYFEANTRK